MKVTRVKMKVTRTFISLYRSSYRCHKLQRRVAPPLVRPLWFVPPLVRPKRNISVEKDEVPATNLLVGMRYQPIQGLRNDIVGRPKITVFGYVQQVPNDFLKFCHIHVARIRVLDVKEEFLVGWASYPLQD